MTDIERVKKVVDWLIFEKIVKNRRDLASLLGYTESSFSQIINSKVPLSDSFIKKLSISDPRINETWLLTGEGEMLKEVESSVIIKGVTPETIVQLAQLTFSEQLLKMFQNKEIAPYSLVEEKGEEIARLNEEIARLNLILGRYEGLLQSHGVEYRQTGS